MQEVNQVIMEQVALGGDLSKMSAKDRTTYYLSVCDSLGLNPLTKPFSYIRLKGRRGEQGKMILYASKDCTEQLRTKNGISITNLASAYDSQSGIYTVTATAVAKNGRTDVSTGAVHIDEQMVGQARANAVMTAETKAKRRVTLSISGLGMLDESEIDSVPATIPPTDKVLDEETTPAIPQEGLAGQADEATPAVLPEEPAGQADEAAPAVLPEAEAELLDEETGEILPEEPAGQHENLGEMMSWAFKTHGKGMRDIILLARGIWPDEEIGRVADLAPHRNDSRLLRAIAGH